MILTMKLNKNTLKDVLKEGKTPTWKTLFVPPTQGTLSLLCLLLSWI